VSYSEKTPQITWWFAELFLTLQRGSVTKTIESRGYPAEPEAIVQLTMASCIFLVHPW